jgi:hypothetical protein
MASKITIKRSLTAAAPAGLSYGEMAFVQGSGNTAEQLYVGISGGNPVWVGARVEDTVTDWTSKTRLATQAATVTKINSLISSNTAGVASVNGLTGAVINVALTTNPLSQFAATTSSQLLGVISDETGTGSLVFATNPTLSGVTLGAATATTINKVAITRPLSGSTITIDDNITFTVSSQNVTLNGSGIGSNVTVPATGTLSTLAGAETLSNKTLSGVTLGTPLSGTLTNCTGLPVGTGISGLGTNVAAFLATPSSANLISAVTDETGTGSLVFASSPTLVTPTLGVAAATSINKVTITAPATSSTITVADGKTLTASNTLTFTGTDASSVAFGTGGTVVYTSGLGTNVATFLATPSSANLISAITDETGTGALVFANTPTLVTPNIGAATGTSLVLSGDLTVNGTTTTLNSTTLTIDDINIELGSGVTYTNATANGGGITLKSYVDKTIIWDSTNSNWTSSEDWNLPTGKVFKINNASVLSSTTLGSAIVTSSLTSVGTITSGTWSGSFGAVSGANLTNINATNVAITSETSDTTCFITFVTNNTGDLPTKVNSSLTYNAVSGELSATLIDGGTF